MTRRLFLAIAWIAQAVTPDQAKEFQRTGHPAGAWFDKHGKPRNTITCTICAEQVEATVSALIDHLDDHGRSWPKRKAEPYVAEFKTQGEVDSYIKVFNRPARLKK